MPIPYTRQETSISPDVLIAARLFVNNFPRHNNQRGDPMFYVALFLIDLLSAVAVVISFPVLCFSQDFYQGLRAGLCLFGTGLSLHFVLSWFFDEIKLVPDENENGEPPTDL